jgi:hypothetical protein
MLRLSYVAIFSGVILSFHDTYWPLAIWCVMAWALLASAEYRFGKKSFF